ncbi:MAG: DUF1822 family protein [Cyanobacteria bacterium P01_F01_bin.150]
MSHSTIKHTQIILPLTAGMHQMAEQFYRYHSSPEKIRQVYLNTLAVLVVDSYLEAIGIETNMEASESWQVSTQALSDVAELPILNRGSLECRPVVPSEQQCYVPMESWGGRIGFVAVQMDQNLEEATILGFLPSVDAETVPLDQWQPIEELLHHLHPRPIQLMRWLEKKIGKQVEMGWQAIEDLRFPSQPTWQFRTRGQSVDVARPVISRGKPLTLASYPPVLLILGLAKTQEDKESDIDIWVKVCVSETMDSLPAGLELQVLDPAGMAVMNAQARETASMEVNFSGTIGETFGIQLVLGEQRWLETFVL